MAIYDAINNSTCKEYYKLWNRYNRNLKEAASDYLTEHEPYCANCGSDFFGFDISCDFKTIACKCHDCGAEWLVDISHLPCFTKEEE